LHTHKIFHINSSYTNGNLFQTDFTSAVASHKQVGEFVFSSLFRHFVVIFTGTAASQKQFEAYVRVMLQLDRLNT